MKATLSILGFLALLIATTVLGIALYLEATSPQFVEVPFGTRALEEPDVQPGEWVEIPVEQGLRESGLIAGPETYTPAEPPIETFSWNGPDVLFFTSDNCGPCLQVEPIVAELKSIGWKVQTVNVTHQGYEGYKQHGCTGTPTLIVFDKRGRVKKRFDGAPVSIPELSAALKS